MKIPAVMPHLQIRVDDAGHLTSDLDGSDLATHDEFIRADLPKLVAKATKLADSPIRVTVTEADGSNYTDIALPSEPTTTGTTNAAPRRPAPGIAGDGFKAGEDVALAYVVLRLTADESGQTRCGLPAALATRNGRDLLLVGVTSGQVVTLENSVQASS